MQQENGPALDAHIASEQGITRLGPPLSYSRAPAPDLAPWISRLYVARVWMPQDYTLSCGLFSDSPYLRVQLTGEWKAETIDGPMMMGRDAAFFGPQSRRMPINVRGSFISVGMALRPGLFTILKGPRLSDYADRLVSMDEMVEVNDNIISLFTPEGSPEDWMTTLENLTRRRLNQRGWHEPDPITAMFEHITLRDPGMSINDAAEECGVERRRLERIVRRDFGMAPKQILRRARALDMAAQLRGVADPSEREACTLRYYDESHLIREFTELFGMSPGQFVKTPQPLMTLTLEARQAARLEALKRIAPGDPMPWK